MTFTEVLVNILGIRSRWFIRFELPEGKGSVAAQGGKVVFAELTYDGKLHEGKKALEKTLEIERNIKDVELQPLEGKVESNVEIDQFELLSLLKVESEDLEKL